MIGSADANAVSEEFGQLTSLDPARHVHRQKEATR